MLASLILAVAMGAAPSTKSLTAENVRELQQIATVVESMTRDMTTHAPFDTPKYLVWRADKLQRAETIIGAPIWGTDDIHKVLSHQEGLVDRITGFVTWTNIM